MKGNRLPHRTLMRGGSQRIYYWPAIPPEAPVPAYHAFDTTTGQRSIHPTLQQASEWCDRNRCPLLAALPFHEGDTNGTP